MDGVKRGFTEGVGSSSCRDDNNDKHDLIITAYYKRKSILNLVEKTHKKGFSEK